MLAAVARTIRNGQLLASGDRVAVALSGGSDSVALLWLLQRASSGELAPRSSA